MDNVVFGTFEERVEIMLEALAVVECRLIWYDDDLASVVDMAQLLLLDLRAAGLPADPQPDIELIEVELEF
jgi:hypothetical protein